MTGPGLLAIGWQDGVGLALAVLAIVYLVLVLVYPEKF